MIKLNIGNLLRILFILVLTIGSVCEAYSYSLSDLDWSKSKKNYCAKNIVKAIWLNTNWNAYTYTQYIDKRENPEVWEIVVIDRYNHKFQNKWSMWYKYWHLAIVIEVNILNNTVKTFDGFYTITLKQDIVAWYISVPKMIELWANIIN